MIVYHQGKEEHYDFSGLKGCTNFHYAAFYADCQHEIKEVSNGYRLCLIYNLLYKGGGACPSPADNGELVNQVVTSMKKWNKDAACFSGPPMMAYLLEHQYCEASLSFEALKNVDRAVADLLMNARKEEDFDLHLATVSVTQEWSGYSYGRYGDYSTDELLEETITAKCLLAPESKHKITTSLDLEAEYCVPENFLDGAQPTNEEYQEATGNEGATVEKWYKYAALLLWPLRKRVAVLGVECMIKRLERAATGQATSKGTEEWRKCVELAGDIVTQSKVARQEPSSKSSATLLGCLQILEERQLVSEFLDAIALSCSSSHLECPSFCNQLMSVGSTFGWKIIQPGIKGLFSKLVSNNDEVCCQLLWKLTIANSSAETAQDQKDTCKELAGIIVKHLSEANASASQLGYWGYKSCPISKGKNLVVSLTGSLLNLDCDEQLALMVKVFLDRPNQYPVLTTLAPALEEL